MKFSQASSRVNILKYIKMEYFNLLTWLLARENFIEFSRRENLKT
jgi:hypothetical protein